MGVQGFGVLRGTFFGETPRRIPFRTVRFRDTDYKKFTSLFWGFLSIVIPQTPILVIKAPILGSGVQDVGFRISSTGTRALRLRCRRLAGLL